MTINNLLEAKHQVKHIDTYYEYKANMEEALYEHQVAVLDRLSFGRIGAEGKHFLRLSTASELGVLRDGVKRLSDAAQDQAGLEKFLRDRPDIKIGS